MQINSQGERMKEIEIFGIPALFSSNRIAPEDVYPGMYRYELLSSKEVPGSPRHLAQDSGDDFMGTVLTPVPIPMTHEGQREIEPGDLFLDIEAGEYTPAEFEEKYLSPDYDPEADRYVNAVTWAVANGITNGTGSNTFSPDVVVSRAQAVTFLYRELA